MSVATTAASTIPSTNSAGSRKRSELSTGRLLGGGGRRGGLVSDPPHRDDRRRVAELPPQLPHVDVDGARVTCERVAPDPLEQLIAREDQALVVEELPKEVELLGRQPDLLVPEATFAPARVEHEVS